MPEASKDFYYHSRRAEHKVVTPPLIEHGDVNAVPMTSPMELSA